MPTERPSGIVVTVIGATGGSGVPVCLFLLGKEMQALSPVACLRAVTRNPTGDRAAILRQRVELTCGKEAASKLKFCKADFSNRAALETAIDGSDFLYLCSPNYRHQLAFECSLIDIAAKCRVKRVVKMSVLKVFTGLDKKAHGVYHHRIHEYAVTKHPELKLVTLGCPYFLQNIPMYFGYGIVTKGEFRHVLQNEDMRWIDLNDAARTVAGLLTCDSETFERFNHRHIDLVGPDNGGMNVEKVCTLLTKYGMPTKNVQLTLDEWKKELQLGGLPDGQITNIIDFHSMLRDDTKIGQRIKFFKNHQDRMKPTYDAEPDLARLPFSYKVHFAM
uniref:NmrA-like domain-containing protein n=1 Tax=Lotharella globosa TaxID=91324 RepID=A0A7S3YEJ8_9EUKA